MPATKYSNHLLHEQPGTGSIQSQVTAAVVQQQMQFLLQLPKVESIPTIPQVKFIPCTKGLTLGQVQVNTLKRPGQQSSRDRLVDSELQSELEGVALGGKDVDTSNALKEKRRKK